MTSTNIISATTDIETTGTQLMDETGELFHAGQVHDGMTRLSLGLKELRETYSADEWNHFSQLQFLQHPLKDLVHQDPLTRHSFEKPRQYSGDAELLDFMYGCRPIPSQTTDLGRQIFAYTTKTGAPQSVRDRRNLLTEMLDELAIDGQQSRVLSVACGHLREAKDSFAVSEGHIREFIAFDQDPLSLDFLRDEMAGTNVHPVRGSVRELLARKHKYRDLDFVYAAGLYDYLTQPVATRLTRVMFEMLRPGGRLLVANFVPTLRDIGYMETFMQWRLIYRDAEELAAVAGEIPESSIAKQRCFADAGGNVVYLEMVKA